MKCRGCGSEVAENTAPDRCMKCPDETCPDCGETRAWSLGVAGLCSCFTRTEDLSRADLKALFADDCDGQGLSVDIRPAVSS